VLFRSTGVISTQNLNPNSGVATPGSFVEISLGSEHSISIQVINNTLNQGMSIQTTTNGIDWDTLTGAALYRPNVTSYTNSLSAGVNGVYFIDTCGALKVRVTMLSACTGSAAIDIKAINATRALPYVQNIASITTSGTPTAPATPFAITSAAGTNATLIRTGTTGLCYIKGVNFGATWAYIHLVNKATVITVGTDIAVDVIPIPPASGGVPGTVIQQYGSNGARFTSGLTISITGGAADTDTTAVGANNVKVLGSATA